MNTLKKITVATSIAMAVSGAAYANGTVTFLTETTSFDDANTTSLAENFESFPSKDRALPSFTANGITYAGIGSHNVWVSSPGYTNYGVSETKSSILTATGDENFSISFSTPVTAVGFDTYLNSYGPATVKVSGAGGLLDTFSLSHNPTQVGFLGITSTEAITSIQWTTTGGASVNTGIDNIRISSFPTASNDDCTPVIYSAADRKITFDTLAMELYNPLTDLPNGQFALFTGADMRLKALPGFYDFKYEGGEPVYADKIVEESDNCYPAYSSREETVHFPKIEIPLVSVLPNGKIVDGPSVCYEALLRESNTQRLVFTLTEVNELSCE